MNPNKKNSDKSKKITNLFRFVIIGFFVIYVLSLAFPHDICGSEEIKSSPRIFFGFAVFWLTIFYFINEISKKWIYYILSIVVISFVFEYFYVQYFMRIIKIEGLVAWIFMPLYWVIWLGLTRIIYGKVWK